MNKLIRRVGRFFKPVLSRTIYRPGTVHAIKFGLGKGLRYKIFPEYGLAPLYGGWEPEVLAVFQNEIRPGMVCYDLGANYGIHTLVLSRLVGSTGQVYSFEPSSRIGAEMWANVQRNGFTNVEWVQSAVAEQSGHMPMFAGHHDGAGHLQIGGHGNAGDHSGSVQTVTVTSLDDFVASGKRPPSFVKIDIEGAEGAALRGTRSVLRKYQPLVLVELHTPEQDIAVGKVLLECGYTAARIEHHHPPITDMTQGWPISNGIWGQILARPKL